jgi:SAM-dependent methyltransferase
MIADSRGTLYRNTGNDALLSLVDLSAPGRALDCGCGAGDNARRLSGSNWKVIGVTISEQEALLAGNYCESVLIHDLEEGLPRQLEGPFDLVLLSHILEHLREPAPLLADARRLLAPDGVLAVALPNVLYWRQRLDFLTGRFDYAQIGILDRTHLRFYTYRSGRSVLVDNGYEIVRQCVEGFLPIPFRRQIPKVLIGPADRAASLLLPGLFGWQLLYTARPARLSSHAASA